MLKKYHIAYDGNTYEAEFFDEDGNTLEILTVDEDDIVLKQKIIK